MADTYRIAIATGWTIWGQLRKWFGQRSAGPAPICPACVWDRDGYNKVYRGERDGLSLYDCLRCEKLCAHRSDPGSTTTTAPVWLVIR